MAEPSARLFFTTEVKLSSSQTATLYAPLYHEHCKPFGYLENPDEAITRESNAAWHFAGLAMRALKEVPEQATLEGDTDVTVSLRNIAESVCTQYGVSDMNLMMRHMPDCRREAFRSVLFWDSRFQAWLDSAGKAYDTVTREPPN